MARWTEQPPTPRCMAITRRGERCPNGGTGRGGGWVGCGHHPRPPQPPSSEATEVLRSALADERWMEAPGWLRLAVERAVVLLEDGS